MEELAQLLREVPPFLQVTLLVLIGMFAALSLASRFSPALSKIWDADELDRKGTGHLVQYTIIPFAVFLAGLAVVVMHWQPRPWLGGWSALKAIASTALVVLGIAAATLGRYLLRVWDISSAQRLRSWIPLVLMLSGIGAMVGGGIWWMS